MIEFKEDGHDFFNADEQFILCIANCSNNKLDKTKEPLTTQLFTKYPEANIYKERPAPATLTPTTRPKPGSLYIKGKVAIILGTLYPGTKEYANDNRDLRLKWFREGLNALQRMLPRSIAVRENFSEEFGGDWHKYLFHLNELDKSIKVSIYPYVLAIPIWNLVRFRTEDQQITGTETSVHSSSLGITTQQTGTTAKKVDTFIKPKMPILAPPKTQQQTPPSLVAYLANSTNNQSKPNKEDKEVAAITSKKKFGQISNISKFDEPGEEIEKSTTMTQGTDVRPINPLSLIEESSVQRMHESTKKEEPKKEEPKKEEPKKVLKLPPIMNKKAILPIKITEDENLDEPLAEAESKLETKPESESELKQGPGITQELVANPNTNVNSNKGKYVANPDWKDFELKITGWDEVINDPTLLQKWEKVNPFFWNEELPKFGSYFKMFPPQEKVFNAFNLCPYKDVRVIIVGQDPYHEDGQAMGLSFSVDKGMAVPSSLNNIFKELTTDVTGFKKPNHGSLVSWANQGVFLLNAALTVREGAAGSHYKAWQEFTDGIITLISQNKKNLVFILWGNFAKKKLNVIKNVENHHILTAAHPSGLSATKGFFGCKCFSQTNDYLAANGLKEIDWNIPN